MTDNTHNESLADRARAILKENEKAKALDQIAEDAGKFTSRVKEHYVQARQTSKIFNRAAEAADTILHYTGPVGRAVLSIGRGLFSTFKYAAFERDKGDFKRDADGDLIFSPMRLAKAFTVAAGLGMASIVGANYAYYHATQFNEFIYTTGKQEIKDGELYHVTGCTSLPCSTQSDNGKYYQITRSLFAPRQIYPEENVFANVPQQIAACDIQGYGIYFKQLKPIFRWAQWYQNIENVSCRPLSPNEVQQSMQQPDLPVAPSPAPSPIH